MHVYRSDKHADQIVILFSFDHILYWGKHVY